MSDIYHQNYYQQNREKLRAYQREYYQAQRQEILSQQKQYKRSKVIRHRLNGKSNDLYGVNKAPYPVDSLCQVCRRALQLTYHHWDDADYSDGLWVCTHCHIAIEAFTKTPQLRFILVNRFLK